MKDENLRRVYEQYWLHARHQETQRLWFTNIYAVIVAGVFAYFGAVKGHSTIETPLLIFLMVLSLFGYLMTYSWNIPFTIFSRSAEEIAIREWDLPEEYQRFTKYREGYEYHKRIGLGKISIRISSGRVFMGFYSLMMGVFIALFFQTACNITNYRVVLLIAVSVFAIIYLYYQFYLEPRSLDKIQKQFEERVGKYRQKRMTKSEVKE